MFGARKAGHTGSLDPSATGMLPICFGEGTKLCGYLLDAEKTYEVEGLLGAATDTEDADGTVVSEAPVPELSVEQMQEIVAGFLGDSLQTPPVYSAIRKNGVRSHSLARRGESVELEPRAINVRSIELLHFSLDRFALRLCVSKGTYIRSIVRDIGEQIGCGAHVTALRRTSVSPFEQHPMYTIEQINETAQQDSLLLAVDQVISDWQSLTLDAECAMVFRNGAKPQLDDSILEGLTPRCSVTPLNSGADLIRVYDPTGKFLGLGKMAGQRLETVRIIGGQLQ